MATMTINVNSSVPLSIQPYIVSSLDEDCSTEIVVKVQVPASQTRYVTVTYTGPATGTDITQTINTTTDYTVTLQGNRSASDAANINYSTGTITVALSSSDPIYYSSFIDRNHDGNIC